MHNRINIFYNIITRPIDSIPVPILLLKPYLSSLCIRFDPRFALFIFIPLAYNLSSRPWSKFISLLIAFAWHQSYQMFLYIWVASQYSMYLRCRVLVQPSVELQWPKQDTTQLLIIYINYSSWSSSNFDSYYPFHAKRQEWVLNPSHWR